MDEEEKIEFSFTSEDRRAINEMGKDDRAMIIGILASWENDIECVVDGVAEIDCEDMDKDNNPIISKIWNLWDKRYHADYSELNKSFKEWFFKVVQECLDRNDYYIVCEKDFFECGRTEKTMFKASNLFPKGLDFHAKSNKPYRIWYDDCWYQRVA